MIQKAMGNALWHRRWMAWLLIVLLILLSLTSSFMAGLAIGGYYESLKLRQSLESIPDINQCYKSSVR